MKQNFCIYFLFLSLVSISSEGGRAPKSEPSNAQKVWRMSSNFVKRTLFCLRRRKPPMKRSSSPANNAADHDFKFLSNRGSEPISKDESLGSFFKPSITKAMIESQQFINGLFWPQNFPNRCHSKICPSILTLDSSFLTRLARQEFFQLSKRRFSLASDFGIFKMKELMEVPDFWKKLVSLSFSGKDLCQMTKEQLAPLGSCFQLQKIIFNLEVDQKTFLESPLSQKADKIKEIEQIIYQNTQLIIENMSTFFKERIIDIELYADDLTEAQKDLFSLLKMFPYLKSVKWNIVKKNSNKIFAPAGFFDTLSSLKHLEKVSFSFEDIEPETEEKILEENLHNMDHLEISEKNTPKISQTIQKEKAFFEALKQKAALQEIELSQYCFKSTSENNLIASLWGEFLNLKKITLHLKNIEELSLFEKFPPSLEMLEFNSNLNFDDTEKSALLVKSFLDQLILQCDNLKGLPSLFSVSDYNSFFPKNCFKDAVNILSKCQKLESFCVSLINMENFQSVINLISGYSELKNLSFSFLMEEKMWDALDVNNPDKRMMLSEAVKKDIYKNLKNLLDVIKSKSTLDSVYLKLEFFDENVLTEIKKFVPLLLMNKLVIDLNTPGVFGELEKENPYLYQELQSLEIALRTDKIFYVNLNLFGNLYYSHMDRLEGMETE